MVIFRFITDKDVFQKFYSKKLAARLVNEASASDDSESSMITKFKEDVGFEYTSKLTKMFQGEPFSGEEATELTFRCRAEQGPDGTILGEAASDGHEFRS
jgi:cullin 1